jgi:hypothetical protein
MVNQNRLIFPIFFGPPSQSMGSQNGRALGHADTFVEIARIERTDAIFPARHVQNISRISPLHGVEDIHHPFKIAVQKYGGYAAGRSSMRPNRLPPRTWMCRWGTSCSPS